MIKEPRSRLSRILLVASTWVSGDLALEKYDNLSQRRAWELRRLGSRSYLLSKEGVKERKQGKQANM